MWPYPNKNGLQKQVQDTGVWDPKAANHYYNYNHVHVLQAAFLNQSPVREASPTEFLERSLPILDA